MGAVQATGDAPPATAPELRMMRPSEVLAWAVMDRAGRDAEGRLTGFQRAPVRSHVGRIAAYLRQPGASLENALVVGVLPEGSAPPDVRGERRDAYVIDGQQRLIACGLAGYDEPVPVLALRMRDAGALRDAFVRINSARPLPRALLAELAVQADPMPPRVGDGVLAGMLVEALNHSAASPLRGMVRQQTNPSGVIRDTALVRGVRNSLRHGVLAAHAGCRESAMAGGLATLCEWHEAVADVFHADWHGHTPRTSRLLHGAGIEAMMHVMDVIGEDAAEEGPDAFAGVLTLMRPHCRWTSGTWELPGGERLPFDRVQNVPGHVAALSAHLGRIAGTLARRGEAQA